MKGVKRILGIQQVELFIPQKLLKNREGRSSENIFEVLELRSLIGKGNRAL